MTWTDAIVACWIVACAIYDIRRRRVPNVLTIGGMGIGIGHLLIHGSGVLGSSAVSAWVAGVGALVVPIPLFQRGWLEAGDIKLMSAIGFLAGLDSLLTVFVLSSFLALPFALWLAIGAHRRQETPLSGTRRLPQAVFLAAGLLLVMAGGTGSGNP
ncbi:MAG TPA: A24 family peptidase [Methylococcaceae bacterium]|nr:A24 family peptidase [Methylococcaceae bacterium]